MAWNAPIISRLALRAYLSRVRRDSAQVKTFSHSALSRKADSLNALFLTPCRTHQLATFLLCVYRQSYAILLDPGLGKTKVALDLIAHWRRCGRLKKALVLVPNTANIQGWLDEIVTHRNDLRAVGITQDGHDARFAAMSADNDVVIITYQGYMAMLCRTVKIVRKGREFNTWVVDESRAQPIEQLFNCVVPDESTYFRNHDSVVWKCLRRLLKTCDYRYPMTGTPFGTDPVHLWTQFYFVDRGWSLGETLGLFRGAMFTTKKNYWSKGVDYIFDLRKKRLLQRFMRHSSIRYRDTECLDLPPRVYATRRVICPQETWDYYGRLIEAVRSARGDMAAVENAWHRLRGMCAGYLKMKDDDGNLMTVDFAERPKVDAIVEWANEIPVDRKAIIFCEYVKSGTLVCDALKSAGYRPLWLHGKAKHKGDIIHALRDDPKRRFLVATSAGAFGHNMQTANYMAFFETPSDPIVREQMERREYRDGQKRRVFITDFVVKGSVDERIVKSLQMGRDLLKEIIEGRQSL